MQLALVPDPAHADPRAAVERLHVERVADLLGDLGEVERPVVARGGVGEPLVGRRLLARDHPGLRHLEAEPHHRAVGRVLLHRLERERVVEQVDAVHQRDLLDPLARDVVPVREPVDDERVARAHAQVERLDRHPLEANAWRSPPCSIAGFTAPAAPRRRPTSPPPCRAAARSGAYGSSTAVRRRLCPRRGRAGRAGADRACRATRRVVRVAVDQQRRRRGPGGAARPPRRGCWRGSPRARRRSA